MVRIALSAGLPALLLAAVPDDGEPSGAEAADYILTFEGGVQTKEETKGYGKGRDCQGRR
jgi:hypothetical protein